MAESDRPAKELDETLTLAMAEAGGRLVAARLNDPHFMRKANLAGELAAQVIWQCKQSPSKKHVVLPIPKCLNDF